MRGKKGQDAGNPIGVIVGIIIAIIVLVVLILGFTVGWDKIVPWLPKDNIQTITTQCSAACALNNQYDYCSNPRVLKDANNQGLTDPADATGRTKGQYTGTCDKFSKDSATLKYNIAVCNALTPCPASTTTCKTTNEVCTATTECCTGLNCNPTVPPTDPVVKKYI